MITLLNGPVYIPSHVREALGQPVCDLRHPRFQSAYAFCRETAAGLLGARDYGVVLAAGSGSFGLELAISSCITPEDSVLALSVGTYGSRLADVIARTGAHMRREEMAPGADVDWPRVEALRRQERPTYVAVTHVEPSTATEIDLRRLGILCRAVDASIIVDGICAGFALDVDCVRDRIAMYITASQKGLALPPGMAVIVASPEAVKRAMAHPEAMSGAYGQFASWLQTAPRFTPPMWHIFGMEASLRYIAQETMPAREARHRAMAAAVAAWGRRRGLRTVAPVTAPAATLTAFYYPDGLGDAWLRRLRDERGLELAPSNDPRLAGRYFRIGHLGDVPMDHLTRGLVILDDAFSERAAEVQA